MFEVCFFHFQKNNALKTIQCAWYEQSTDPITLASIQYWYWCWQYYRYLDRYAHLYCKRRKWRNIGNPYKRFSAYKAEMRRRRAERTENRLELTLIPGLTTTPGPNWSTRDRQITLDWWMFLCVPATDRPEGQLYGGCAKCTGWKVLAVLPGTT